MKERIRKVLFTEMLDYLSIEKSEVTDDSKLKDAGIDSISIIIFILSLENEFNIEFPEDYISIEKFSSINDTNKTIKEYFENEAKK